jgi:AbrB family looped-hinge helix DNA binding protein
MRITSKGQVTIPKHVRDRVGLLPLTAARFQTVDGGAMIRPVEPDDAGSFEEWLRSAPRPDAGLSTDEILAMTRERD